MLYLGVVSVDVLLVTLYEYALPPRLAQYKLLFVFATATLIAAVPVTLMSYLRFITPQFRF